MPTVQSVTVGAQNETGTITCSVPVNAGNNLAIFAAIHIEAFSDDCTAMTRDGQSLTEHGVINSTAWTRTEIWKLVNPNLGTNTLTATVAGPGSDRARLVVWVVEDVHQVTPLRAARTHTGTAGVLASANIVGLDPTDLIIDALTIDAVGHSPVVGANQLSQYNTNDGANSAFEMAGSKQDGVDGSAMTWTWTTAAPFSYIAVAVIAPPVPSQQIYPDADIVTTGWSTAPLWSKIDEASAGGDVISGVAS